MVPCGDRVPCGDVVPCSDGVPCGDGVPCSDGVSSGDAVPCGDVVPCVMGYRVVMQATTGETTAGTGATPTTLRPGSPTRPYCE